ncbi:carotenoid oxygenase family protein [Mycolicibacterium komossense]|uniref:Dioxygenase n=1 Tax=Mycolicibacterium komossense TaxID=1779 RepID=A0ABT3CLA1_9MYCO|nr:carotenoid oxygenase family protein [Mycolicibacterium komossense]MCV7230309.1 carotenoid oxygenase family protein [Mycolicibacterium komossense]
MWDDNNRSLNGPFEPWHQEANTFDLEVVGEIPRELNGALYRTSSNPHVRPINPDRYHWFDGDGMVYGVFLRDGRAHAANRWVKTAGFKIEEENGKAVYGSVFNGGVVPDFSIDPPMKNPANTNVTLFDDRLLVFTEVGLPHELHPTNLETRGQYDYHGCVAGPVTAHWKTDPRNGDMLFYGVSGSEMTWYQANSHGKLLDSYKFDMGVSCFMHDFAATDDYAVFVINPTVYRPEAIMAGTPGVVWDPQASNGTRFAVLNRHTHVVTWIDGGGAYSATHFYNAYSDGDRIVVDGHRTQRWGRLPEEAENIRPGQDFNKWFDTMVATPWRWVLDLGTGRMTDRQITDVVGEFPRINDDYALREHRFGYYATTRGVDGWLTDGLAKHDYRGNQTTIIPTGELISPSEPVFVPRESATGEDDGWMMSLWWNPFTRLSELLIHDALHFGAEPVARVKLNQRVPMGFHGNWVDGSVIEAALSSQTA